jgi:hypothetical protein
MSERCGIVRGSRGPELELRGFRPPQQMRQLLAHCFSWGQALGYLFRAPSVRRKLGRDINDRRGCGMACVLP